MRAAVLLVLAVACKPASAPELVPGTYPGFSLDVPAELGAAEANAPYRRGIARSSSDTAVYSIGWNVGQLPDASVQQGFADTVAKEIAPERVLATTRIRAGNREALRFDLRKGDDFWALVVIGCGERLIRVMAHVREHGEPTLQRMLASFQCRPDAAAERVLVDAMPVGLDDLSRVAGWMRQPSKGEVMITDRTHTATFAYGSGSPDDLDMLRTTVTKWKFGAKTTSEVRGETRTWSDFETEDGQTGVVSAWSCGPETGAIALVVGYSAAHARDFLGAFRCPSPGDKPFIAKN